ncbi:MAG: Uma2 family endonuclease [Acidobacteria bacterium]|nr:Uma2 family endonuclease [Acidobacteriota bacterium]
MVFSIDDSLLPATLTAGPMTDEEFAAFCSEHPDLNFEMTAEGVILVMPPTYSSNGVRNSLINNQLGTWARIDRRGVTPDSSTGFMLPNGARRAPDAGWIAKSRIPAAGSVERDRYWRLSPDFVIELKSSTDRLHILREKMEEWIANGTSLGWLIDPEARTVEIYRAGRGPEILKNPDRVHGEGPVEGFTLDLTEVWDPFAEPPGR